MMITESNKPKIGLFDKVKEYYREDKKLGGLITVTETVFMEKMGRELLIVFPNMSKHDEVFINGHRFVPQGEDGVPSNE